jgi:hypothetical protein
MAAKMHRNPSVMKHSFSQVPTAEIPRSKFNRSHGHKTAFDAGLLIPFYVDEVMPGDTFSLNTTSFVRLATPIFPLMDNMYLDTQFFFVPFRLIWENWEKQQGAQVNPGDPTDFLEPQIIAPAVTGHAANSIYDYMGVPPGVPSLPHSALPLRAYALIYNQWYRDQNLQDSLVIPLGDGPDVDTAYQLMRRGKRHDYFAACLPWPQKGQAVQIPLGTTAPVIGAGAPEFSVDNVANTQMFAAAGTGSMATTAPGSTGALSWVNPKLTADLTSASAATINSLRQAFAIQKMFERDARGGTRYIEVVQAHWKVKSPDARLQRCEYLGGGSTPITVSPVPQTSASGAYADSPQGNLAAYGTGVGTGHGFHMSFTEHGLVLGLCSVRADLTYQQGLERMWSRRTRVDRYWPALAHLGEQAVLRREIFATGVQAEDETVFGYQERAGDYRYKPSRISGLFRSSHPQSLDAWHLSQDFATAPVLGPTFIEENPPLARVIAVTSEPHFIADFYVQCMCARPMPLFGVPGFIDRF